MPIYNASWWMCNEYREKMERNRPKWATVRYLGVPEVPKETKIILLKHTDFKFQHLWCPRQRDLGAPGPSLKASPLKCLQCHRQQSCREPRVNLSKRPEGSFQTTAHDVDCVQANHPANSWRRPVATSRLVTASAWLWHFRRSGS